MNAPTYAQSQIRQRTRGKLIPVQTIQKYKFPLLLIIIHIPLGLLVHGSSSLSYLHQIAVLLLGLYYASRRHEKLEKVAYVIAYIVGAEVLWRMGYSAIFYYGGKYAAATIMIIALYQRGYLKIPQLPLLYFVFLIPSCFLTLMDNSLSIARGKLSSNMSGPFLLCVSCWFFSNLKISEFQLKKLLLTIIVPLVSVATVTLFFTVTIEDIQFNTESNAATSGGFGPNQVSTMLGLGVFVGLSCYLLFKNSLKDTLFLGVFSIFFTAQSVMTFSRSGVYNAVGATLIVVILQMRSGGQGIRRLLPIVGLGLLFLLLIFPILNNFTDGALQERFDDTGTANRTTIIESDFYLFSENPVLGIGPGNGKAAREELEYKAVSSHTEFSRLVSEHGILGIFSLMALGFATIYNFGQQKSAIGKAFVVGVVAWSSLYMLNSGMRLAAPSIIWGLSFVTILTQQKKYLKIESKKIQ